MTRRWRVWALLLALLALVVPPAAAHGYLVRALPADRAVLERAPTRLQYWFSEALEPRFSGLLLRDSRGTLIASGAVDVDNNHLLTLTLPPGTLVDGAYVVELRPAFASDSHVTAESRVFFVGAANATIASVAAASAAQPLEIVWKALLLAGTSLLFGAYGLYGAVLLPAWGSRAHPVGGLPPRVLRRLNAACWGGFGLTALALLLALLQQSMLFFNTDAATVISGGLWQVVRQGSRFGDVWTARGLLLALLIALHGGSLVYSRSFPGLLPAVWRANGWLVALLLGAQAITSHAAGALALPWVALASHWLHTLAVSFWLGGVVVLVLVLPPALAPYPDDQRQVALRAVMQRFSRLLVGLLALVMTTGLYNASNWFYAPEDGATDYGRALAFKLLLVVLLVGMGALHHVALRPALLKNGLGWLARALPWFRRFGGSLRLEALLGLGTLTLAAVLSATPIPQPAFLRTIDSAAPTQTLTADDLTVVLSLAPGGAGVNTFDVILERAGRPVEAAQVALQVAQPAADQRSAWLPLDPVEAGLYVSANAAITTPGKWWTLLNITRPTGTTRAAFAWEIAATITPTAAQPPTALNLGALVLVLVAAGYVLRPTAQAAARRLNWHPASLLVAGGAVGVTLALLAAGTWLVQEQLRQTEAALYPPPQVVNPTLPDAASLQRGGALVAAHCAAWANAPDWDTLRRSLGTLRDETLFTIPAAGWRRVPACAPPLTDAQRWDVVNYLRTLAR